MRLTQTCSILWQDATVFWQGLVGKGTHEVWLQSPQANVWGCAGRYSWIPSFGNGISVTVLPDVPGVAAYQTPDTRVGCPPNATSNSTLIEKKLTVNISTMIMVTGHMAGLKEGRANLELYIDGYKEALSVTDTASRQWEDAKVFWLGWLDVGPHTIWLQSPQENTWGCEADHGDLDILAIANMGLGAAAYHVLDTRPGCPAKSDRSQPLIDRRFDVDDISVVVIRGHLMGKHTDFHMNLYLDFQAVDQGRGYT